MQNLRGSGCVHYHPQSQQVECLIFILTILMIYSCSWFFCFQVSQKTLVRRQNQASRSGDSISYSLLDAIKHPAFLISFDKAGYKSLDKLLVAYKPRKGKFAAYSNGITMEEVEKFVSSILSGDVGFSNVRQKPVVR